MDLFFDDNLLDSDDNLLDVIIKALMNNEDFLKLIETVILKSSVLNSNKRKREKIRFGTDFTKTNWGKLIAEIFVSFSNMS